MIASPGGRGCFTLCCVCAVTHPGVGDVLPCAACVRSPHPGVGDARRGVEGRQEALTEVLRFLQQLVIVPLHTQLLLLQGDRHHMTAQQATVTGRGTDMRTLSVRHHTTAYPASSSSGRPPSQDRPAGHCNRQRDSHEDTVSPSSYHCIPSFIFFRATAIT